LTLAAIRAAPSFIVVLSQETVNSPWVKREIDLALAVQAARGPGYRVLPLLLPGMKPAALGLWFPREPLAVPVALAPGRLAEALPAILAGLGLRLPEDQAIPQPVAPQPVHELILELRDPEFATVKGVRRARATATLVYEPADKNAAQRIVSQRYTVSAALGPIENAWGSPMAPELQVCCLGRLNLRSPFPIDLHRLLRDNVANVEVGNEKQIALQLVVTRTSADRDGGRHLERAVFARSGGVYWRG
jgi:hypothetical protein